MILDSENVLLFDESLLQRSLWPAGLWGHWGVGKEVLGLLRLSFALAA